MRKSRPVWIALFIILLWEPGAKTFSAEKTPDQLKYEARQKEMVEQMNRHLEAWKAAKGEKREEEASEAYAFAWRAQNFEVLDEVLSDGHLAETEVKVPDEVRTVKVAEKLRVSAETSAISSVPTVWRRITSDAFEVWTPTQGWLFNAQGKLLHTVRPSRDHSQGREWFGAFLPDGRWITTELHDGDGRVYIFDRKGRCTHEIKAGALAARGPYRESTAVMRRVSWARSNKDGDGWVVRTPVDDEFGYFGHWADALLSPDGTWQVIGGTPSVWRQCLARQLGVRNDGGVAVFRNESDDGKLLFRSSQPAHGPGCGNPDYEFDRAWAKTEDEAMAGGLGAIAGGGDDFGFWPRSYATYVLGQRRTWFHDAAQKYRGWIGGQRVGDAVRGKGMIFRLWDGRCITVSPELKAEKSERFVLSDGTTLWPLELYPDAGLGVFAKRATERKDEDAAFAPTHSSLLQEAQCELILGSWMKPKRTGAG